MTIQKIFLTTALLCLVSCAQVPEKNAPNPSRSDEQKITEKLEPSKNERAIDDSDKEHEELLKEDPSLDKNDSSGLTFKGRD